MRSATANAPFKNNAVWGLWALLLLQSTHGSLLRGYPQKPSLWAGRSCHADRAARLARDGTDLLLANHGVGGCHKTHC